MNHEALSKILRQIVDDADDAHCNIRNLASELDELGIEQDDTLKRIRTSISATVNQLDSLCEMAERARGAAKLRSETLQKLRESFEKQLADARLQEPDSQQHLLDFDKFRFERAEAMSEQQDDESNYCGAW